MAIEEQLSGLTDSVDVLTQAIMQLIDTLQAAPPVRAESTAVPPPVTTAPAAAATRTHKTTKNTPAENRSAIPLVDQNATDVPDYETVVRPAVLNHAEKHGLKATTAILLKFGASHAKAIAPQKYRELMEALG
jgi:hypothetical protein